MTIYRNEKVSKVYRYFVFANYNIIWRIFFDIKYKSTHVKDNKNLELSINKQSNRFISERNSIGLVIGVVKNDKAWIQEFGTIKKGEKALPDSNSIFELASISKLFTTSTLQLLVDDGKCKLVDKIQTILNDKVRLPSSAQNTNLLHLATHTSGFPALPSSFLEKMTDESNPYKDLVTEDIYKYIQRCAEKQEEGKFEYSNFGMGLLGHLLELKTGTKYEILVRQKLLEPLGMKNSFVTKDSLNKDKIVVGYDEDGNPSPIWTDTVLTGAGSFLSNASDMIKFIRANLNNNKTAISKSLIRTHQQQLRGETGLGWILPNEIDKLLGNKNIVWHNGMAGGYSSFIVVDKVNNYGIIILSNQAKDVSKFAMQLTKTVST